MSFSVLIIEDDSQFRRLVELRLQNWRPDAKLVFAETLAAARNILAEANKAFDLVILDQHLPDGLGVEMLTHEKLQDSTILAVSADDAPEVPARAVKAGAHHFLGKRQMSEPLFVPLLNALIERRSLEREVLSAKLQRSKMESIRVMLATLRHEINNPLGAVLGGAYLVRTAGNLSAEQKEALNLIEASGKRMNHVLTQLCETADLEEVMKANEQVFHVPGDTKWDESQRNKKKTES